MKRQLTFLVIILFTGHFLSAQALPSFSVNMQPSEDAFLSIKNKRSYSENDAAAIKQDIDLALIFTKEDAGSRIEWYNLGGKDDKIPANLRGSSTRITTLNFDKQQFDKCRTVQDLTRMTGYLTNNSFAHFATLANGNTCDTVINHCFVLLRENGKKALMWVEASVGCSYKVFIKKQP